MLGTSNDVPSSSSPQSSPQASTSEDAFLTGIDSSTAEAPSSSSHGRYYPSLRNQELSNVKFEHDKLQSIIAAFGEKIDAMKSKQAGEYVEAYDVHMRDVQQKLHELKEDLAEVTNASKKAEKLKELQRDQIHYRQEAVRLDHVAVANRKKIRDMTAKLNGVERERDWLLRRLRKEKKRFKRFTRKLEEVMDKGHDDSSESVFTDASSISFEVMSPLGSPVSHTMSPLQSPNNDVYLPSSVRNSSQKGKRTTRTSIAGKQMLKTTTRSSGKIKNQGGVFGEANDDFDDISNPSLRARRNNDDEISNVFVNSENSPGWADDGRSEISNLEDEISYTSGSFVSAMTADTNVTSKNFKDVNKLVKRRMVISDMQKMLTEAINQTASGFWTKYAYTDRSIDDVVADCVAILRIGGAPSDVLLNELMALPEVYQVILSLINANTQTNSHDKLDDKSLNSGLQSVLSCYF